jgi:hypothetical protein
MNPYLTWIINLPWGTIWQAVSAIATIFAALMIFFAIKQLRFQAWLEAQKIFVEDEFRKSRGQIFSYLAPKKDQHDEKDEEHFARVCQLMDELCRLEPYLGKSKMLSTWDDPIGKTWFVAQSWVKKERDICNWSTKWDAFEKIGTEALKKLRKENRAPKLGDNVKLPS